MSAVIHQTKEHYIKSFIFQSILMIFICFFVFFWKKSIAIDFFIGMLVGYLPHILLVFWVFFRRNLEIQQKLNALYYGEGIKWLTTILLMVLSFRLKINLNIISFFTGYILLIILNNLVPFLLSLMKKQI